MHMTVYEAEKRWVTYCRRYTKTTQLSYTTHLMWFLDWLPDPVKEVSEITPEHVRDFLERLISKKKVKKSTYNLYLNVIRAFFKFLCKYFRLENNPALAFENLKTEDTIVRYLTEKEFEAIWELEGKDRDMTVFIAYTGLRVSEFCGLHLSDFADGYTSVTITGKGRKRRCIPLNPVCREILEKYEGKINYGVRNKRLVSRDVNRKLTNVALKAGICDFNPHALRHYFATALLIRGVQIEYVSKLMGHSDSIVTERTYIHILPGHLKNVTECLDDDNNGKKDVA